MEFLYCPFCSWNDLAPSAGHGFYRCHHCQKKIFLIEIPACGGVHLIDGPPPLYGTLGEGANLCANLPRKRIDKGVSL